MKNNEINIVEATNILNEIRQAFHDIPFGNTAFQTNMFVIAAQITPARAYRSIGLELMEIIRELKNLKKDEELNKLKLEVVKEQLLNDKLNIYEKRKLEYEAMELDDCVPDFEKRINDRLNTFAILYKHFKKLPKFTREQFEEQEKIYYEQSLQRQTLGIVGAKEAIVNMIEDKKNLDDFEKAYESLSLNQKDVLLLDLTKQILKYDLKEN
jgi:hypothetical protein